MYLIPASLPSDTWLLRPGMTGRLAPDCAADFTGIGIPNIGGEAPSGSQGRR